MPGPLVIPFEISFSLTSDPRRLTLHELQRDVRREARKALTRGLCAAIAQIEKSLLVPPPRCKACGHPMRSRGRTARRVVTIFGSVEIRRARYRCPRCGAMRRPLDDWLGSMGGTECTALVREQALYLVADLPYERAAEVLRHIGGIGVSGRQIQRLLEAESRYIDAALGSKKRTRTTGLVGRFRRAGKGATTVGARRVLQLKRLRDSGLWDAYWSGRVRGGLGDPPDRTSSSR